MRSILIIFSFLLPGSSLLAQTINPERIEIIRDTFGVPHIYAPTDAEVAYGLAWAHAEDDFQTIQLTLLGAKQMLGRHLGKDGAAVDYVVGLLDCEQVVKDHKSEIAPDFLMVMEGYVQGLNAYAQKFPQKRLLKKAFPVTVDDMLQAYVLSLSVMLGADKAIQSMVNNELPNIWGAIKGSNAFAINRSRTSDNRVYLAVNSHQPLEGPVSWYEAHLVSDEGWNAMGGLFPGGATIFHGTNPFLGWAHTVNYPDKLDIWQLEMMPQSKNTYLVDGQPKELVQKKVKLKVKVLPGINIGIRKKAYRSIYGPVIKNDHGFYAFDIAALHDLRVPEQWYRMNKARDFEAFKTALEMMSLPMFNIIYADRKDNIFYVSNAKLPKRNPAYDWSGVVPGNTLKTYYDDYYAFSALPQLLNPQSGYVYNTNHSPFLATAMGQNMDSANYDATMGYRIWDNNRSLRFRKLIESYDTLNYQDFLRIKYDLQLPDSLAFNIDFNPIFEPEYAVDDSNQALLTILQNWDRVADIDAIGPAHLITLYQFINEEHPVSTTNKYRPDSETINKGMKLTTSYFMENFGKLEVTLGEYQQLVRGEKELPLKGMPDVLAAMYAQPYKDGRMKGAAGESYIMMVQYPKDGLPIIETINVYGASNQEDSPHYADQMELFLNEKRKKMTLDIEVVRKNAKSIYHPE